jgi:class 3 adenylate cyclase
MLAPDKQTATILVVDDNINNLKVITQYLENEGFEIMTARDGRDGLEKALRGRPDLILLDVLMPEMDGFETCRRLKADERTHNIPILFMTALDNVDDKVRGFTAGGVDYITKPFQAEEVMARVKTHLTLYQLQRQQRDLFRRFATKEVANELLESGFALGGRYVEATAMFSDIRSFTSITESQSPGATIELLNDYFAHMIEAIGSEGGIINQIVGDGLMAIFGAPIAHEHHCRRAVRAALRMMKGVQIFNRDQAAAGKVQIRIGIGIASGRVIAGYLGTDVRATYTCVGDTVNTAARLETHTKELGQPILIDAATRQALDEYIQVIDHGMVSFKGKSQEVHVFSVPVEQHHLKPVYMT